MAPPFSVADMWFTTGERWGAKVMADAWTNIARDKSVNRNKGES